MDYQAERLGLIVDLAEQSMDIVQRFSNDSIEAGSIQTASGPIKNLKQVSADIKSDGETAIDVAVTELIETLKTDTSVDALIDGLTDSAALAEASAERSESSASMAAAFNNPFASTAAGLNNTSGSGDLNRFFSVMGAGSTLATAYRNDAGSAVKIGEAPSVKAVTDLGIEDQSTEASGLSFGMVDDDERRLWLEAGLDGGPTPFAAAKIGATLTEENSPALAEGIAGKAVLESLEAVGIEDQSNDLTGLSFSMIDDDERRLWLEAGLDGGPTPFAAAKIGATLTEENSPALAEGIAGKAVLESLEAVGIEVLSELNDQSFAITDEHDRRLWLEAGLDGKPSAYAMKCIVEKLPGDIGGAPSTYNAGTKGVLKMVSGPNFVAPGDSMTAGAGGNGTNYTGVLQALLAAAGHPGTVKNRGVGGENSVTITARMGGYPFMVLPVAEVIPATTTPFEITLLPINGQMPAPLKQGSLTYTGRLGAVPGTFSRTESGGALTYYFTRATAGSEVVANRPVAMYLDIGIEARSDIYLIWIGQNGPDTTRAIQDAKALIQQMTALDKRYLVISKPGGTSAQDAEDAQWFAEFGRRFIPIRQYMVKYGLADAGITPTEQDLIDMASGTMPSSLRVDPTHWGAAGYTILGNVVFQRLIEMEWV
ncbi:hypothetical protein [Pseudomonas helleri]|uniref:hypothetical protein n=2 Tax=Pseudomonas helleri TaxID=1608996 RepID=UPI003F9C230D